MSFQADPIEVQDRPIPYFEDIKAKDVAGRETTKSISRLQSEIIELLAKLGASPAYFVPGTFDTPQGLRRYGFQIRFKYGVMQGRIDCAALPIKAETAIKKDKALRQALYLVRLELEAAYNSVMYKPGAVPLVPYLICAGDQTVTEALIETQALPMLAAEVES